MSPSAPADLRGAGVSHGSAGQLVTQAITTAMPCTRGCARSAGQALIAKQAMPPTAWLNAFGHAINTATSGSRDTPLPLGGEPARHWRLRASLRCVGGLSTADWERPYLKAKLASGSVALPKCRCGEGGLAGQGSLVWFGGWLVGPAVHLHSHAWNAH